MLERAKCKKDGGSSNKVYIAYTLIYSITLYFYYPYMILHIYLGQWNRRIVVTEDEKLILWTRKYKGHELESLYEVYVIYTFAYL